MPHDAYVPHKNLAYQLSFSTKITKDVLGNSKILAKVDEVIYVNVYVYLSNFCSDFEPPNACKNIQICCNCCKTRNNRW